MELKTLILIDIYVWHETPNINDEFTYLNKTILKAKHPSRNRCVAEWSIHIKEAGGKKYISERPKKILDDVAHFLMFCLQQ